MSVLNTSAIATLTVLLAFAAPNLASAGAMAAMADANNAFYRDLRELGPNAKAGDIIDAHAKDFGPAMAALNAEHYQKYQNWKKSIKANFAETKEAIAEMLGLGPNSGKDADGTPSKGGPAGGTPAPVRIGRQADTTTGNVEGSEGAKDVKYGGKRQQEAPKVNSDGIITE